jgi:hypothetical protein
MGIVVGILLASTPFIFRSGGRNYSTVERGKAFSKLAESFKFQYFPEPLNHRLPGGFWQQFGDHTRTRESQFLERFDGFWPLSNGSMCEVRDLILGSSHGIDWTIFEFGDPTLACHTSVGAAHEGVLPKSPLPYGIVCASLPMDLPSLHFSEQTLFNEVRCLLGTHEVTFETEDFNRRYFVRACDERAAFDILHPQAIDYLLGLPVRDWQMRGSDILIARPVPFSPDELPVLLDEVRGFIDLIPGYIREDRGTVLNEKGFPS